MIFYAAGDGGSSTDNLSWLGLASVASIVVPFG